MEITGWIAADLVAWRRTGLHGFRARKIPRATEFLRYRHPGRLASQGDRAIWRHLRPHPRPAARRLPQSRRRPLADGCECQFVLFRIALCRDDDRTARAESNGCAARLWGGSGISIR